MIRGYLKYYFRKLLLRLHAEDHKALILLSNQLLKSNLSEPSPKNLHQLEFQVFSQFGEDGIIQYLVNTIDIPNKVFVEFGVEDYVESNTRLLLVNNNWRGMVLDGSYSNIKFIKTDSIYWRHNLTAVHSFVTTDNINGLIKRARIEGDIGLLSIDIDGNDYWLWESVSVISPRIVIVEYNSVLGPDLKVTVPYDPSFVRGRAHFSHLYFGASLAALCDLAFRKGYYFIGCNSNGNNAFFIRNDIKTFLTAKLPSEGYVTSQFRESKNKKGQLSFAAGADRLKIIQDLEFFDLNTNSKLALKKIK
jgi:hypothetical protein